MKNYMANAKIWHTLIRIFILLLTITGGWQLLFASGLVNPLFLPSPIETAHEAVRLASEGRIFLDAGYTILRIIGGVALAVAVGVPVGLFMGLYRRGYEFCEPAIDFLRSIPPVIMFPLALLIFGVGEESRIAVIASGCGLIVLFSTAQGIRQCNPMRLQAARLLGARWNQLLFGVLLFEALPQLFSGLRVALSLGVIIDIVTEMLVGTRYGLGSRIVYAQTAYETPELYLLILLVGFIGYSLNKAMILLDHRIIHWR